MMIEPTVEQAHQCAIVQQEFVELVNRLLDEGIDRRILSAGIAAATNATIASFYGAEEVATWFAKQSVMAVGLAKARSVD